MKDCIKMMPAPRWASPQAKEFFDHLQNEIAKAFTIPPGLVSAGPRLIDSHLEEAWRATEVLRKQAVEVYIANTTPVVLVKAAE